MCYIQTQEATSLLCGFSSQTLQMYDSLMNLNRQMLGNKIKRVILKRAVKSCVKELAYFGLELRWSDVL